MQDTLVQEILKRPDATLQLEYLQSIMEEEVERRKTFREWLKADVKAEFINGDVVIHSPVKKRHWSANDLLSSLLSFYVRINKIGRIGTEKVMISLSRNDYEPDLVFFSNEKTKHFTDDQVLFPAPDFVVEILSPSTAKTDRTIKKEDYALHGIKEYWIIDPDRQRIEQHILHGKDTTYFPAKVHQFGDTIESYAIKGFDIPVAAVFDEVVNVTCLQDLMRKSEAP